MKKIVFYLMTEKGFKVLKKAIEIIRTELSDEMRNTSSVSQNMLNAARVIQFIESGQNAVTFDSVSVVKSSPNMPKTFAWSFVLGGLIGVFIVFIRFKITNHKEKMAEM